MKNFPIQILFVEDDTDTIEILRFFLPPANYQITISSTCAESLVLAKAGQFDLYLLGDPIDYQATADLCRDLRAFDFATPIIFCSAAASPVDCRRGLSAGAQVYLTKPYEFDELRQNIDHLLASSRELIPGRGLAKAQNTTVSQLGLVIHDKIVKDRDNDQSAEV